MLLNREVASSAAAGVALHLGYFIHGEHHFQSPFIFRAVVVAPVVIFLVQLALHDLQVRTAFYCSALDVGAFFGSLLTSIGIYRTFFHVTRHFPGPKLAGVSKFYHFFKIVRKGDQFLWMEKLHNQYGDFVRTGPNEVTIFTPEGIAPIYGPKSKCTKTAWYDMTKPLMSVIICRSPADHAVQRKYWEIGVSIKALKEYEDRVYYHARKVAQELQKYGSKPFAINNWAELFVWDIMGDMIFGLQWNLIEGKNDEMAEIIRLNKEGMGVLGPFTPIPWAYFILFSIKALLDGWFAFRAWAVRECTAMINSKADLTCIFTEIVTQIKKGQGDTEQTKNWLLGNFIAGVGSSSATVNATLTFLTYYLASRPDILATLQEELGSIEDISDYSALSHLPYLDSLIKEIMRLHPPVPSGSLRSTPPEGITVAGQFIPGGVTVMIPQYILHRLESCYVRPLEFIPERWTSRPELVKDPRAWIPFTTGVHACVGKNLALMELRFFIAVLASQYNISLAPGETGHNLIADQIDAFTVEPGKLNIVISER